MRTILLIAAALAVSAPASAAVRTFMVEDFSRLRIEGPYNVQLVTGVPPFAKASGSTAALDSISIDVEDGTLKIRPNLSGWTNNNPGQSNGLVTVSIGTHGLSSAVLNGAGSLTIDKVDGDSFALGIAGPGAIDIGRLSVDTFKLGISGNGSAIVAGNAPTVTVMVQGASSFDGSALTSEDATIGAQGAAVVKLRATGTAKVNAEGPASVILAGRPECTLQGQGAGEVSGCR